MNQIEISTLSETVDPKSRLPVVGRVIVTYKPLGGSILAGVAYDE